MCAGNWDLGVAKVACVTVGRDSDAYTGPAAAALQTLHTGSVMLGLVLQAYLDAPMLPRQQVQKRAWQCLAAGSRGKAFIISDDSSHFAIEFVGAIQKAQDL